MAGNPNPNVATRFQPGNTLGGRPKGARSRLGEQFFERLRDDFDEHGVGAIEAMRVADPSGYVTLIGRLMPKELEARLAIQTAPGNLSPDEWARLRDILAMVERIAPPGTSPDAVLAALENGLRAELAAPLVELEVLPAPVPPCPVKLPE